MNKFAHQKNQMLRTTLSFFILLLHLNSAFAQKNWKLASKKEGIQIYSAAIPDSKVNAIRVECSLIARPTQIVALLMDVESAPNWIYHTKSCKLIKRISPSELYYYSEVSVPWPVENRDFVAHLTVNQDAKSKVVIIDGPAVSGYVPIKAGIVRIDNSKGKWIITPEPNGRIHIEYTLHADPGGAIPSWMVNMFATEGPLQIFRQLKLQLEKPEYKKAQLAYIQD